MQLQRKKNWLLLLGVFLIIGILISITYLKGAPIQKSLTLVELGENMGAQDLHSAAADHPDTIQLPTPTSVKNSNKVEEPGTVMGTAAEAEVVKRWQVARGDIRFIPTEYTSYSIETLQKLSDAGDIYAMQILADKIQFLTRDGEDKAKSLLMKASMYGSTYALNMQSINELHNILDAKDESERKARVIENLVYIKAAALRGDLTHYYRDAASPLASRNGVVLTTADVNEINDKATALISTLQKQRIALGLGEFDNTQPPEVKRFFENIDPSATGYKPYF